MDATTVTKISREFKGYPALAVKMEAAKASAALGPAAAPAEVERATRIRVARVLAPYKPFAAKILASLEG